MTSKHALIFAIALVACSPNLTKVEYDLIGKWSISTATLIIQHTPDFQTGTWDTIYYSDQIDFDRNELILNYTSHRNENSPTDTSITIGYLESNDTLVLLLDSSARSYYQYKIANDSLTIVYLYGGPTGLNLINAIPGRYKRE
jgi:hypothetical protein